MCGNLWTILSVEDGCVLNVMTTAAAEIPVSIFNAVYINSYRDPSTASSIL